MKSPSLKESATDHNKEDRKVTSQTPNHIYEGSLDDTINEGLERLRRFRAEHAKRARESSNDEQESTLMRATRKQRRTLLEPNASFDPFVHPPDHAVRQRTNTPIQQRLSLRSIQADANVSVTSSKSKMSRTDDGNVVAWADESQLDSSSFDSTAGRGGKRKRKRNRHGRKGRQNTSIGADDTEEGDDVDQDKVKQALKNMEESTERLEQHRLELPEAVRNLTGENNINGNIPRILSPKEGSNNSSLYQSPIHNAALPPSY